MRKFTLIILVILVILGLAGCSSMYQGRNNATKIADTSTIITKQNWYVTKQNYNGTLYSYTVHLQIAGNSEASTLAVSTVGNGLITEKPIIVVNGSFSQDVVVAYFMLSMMNINPNYSTSVKVISNFKDGTSQLSKIDSPVLDFSLAETIGN
ncbi:MAG: hypothetical protein NTX05_06785 [Fusobacteria bacterium]|nr:hypothetical protein [Fusobacteriota bacterium]